MGDSERRYSPHPEISESFVSLAHHGRDRPERRNVQEWIGAVLAYGMVLLFVVCPAIIGIIANPKGATVIALFFAGCLLIGWLAHTLSLDLTIPTLILLAAIAIWSGKARNSEMRKPKRPDTTSQ